MVFCGRHEGNVRGICYVNCSTDSVRDVMQVMLQVFCRLGLDYETFIR